MSSRNARLLAFIPAYQIRHGSLPAPLVERRQGRDAEGLRAISDISLEGLVSGTLLKTGVSPHDMIVLRAGNAVFRALFLGADDEDGLRFLSFDNMRSKGMRSLRPGERCILWHGTRMDFSGFTVFMHRLAPGRAESAPQVELAARFESFLEVG